MNADLQCGICVHPRSSAVQNWKYNYTWLKLNLGIEIIINHR